MRNYIILNDQNSNDISGLLIQSLAPISKPLMRTEIEEIDGRDGDITTKLGYSAYDKQITIGLFGNYDVDQVIAFFNSEGTAIFSNEPNKYYNYQIVDQIDFERLVRYKTATVTMHCQPFKYSTTEGADILSSSDNFATLNQSLNTDSGFYTYSSNVQADVTATRQSGTGGKFFAVFTVPVVQGVNYHFSGNVSRNVSMYGYTDQLRGTSAGIAGKGFSGNFVYTATFTGTMVLGFYSNATTEIFIRNFAISNEAGSTVSDEGTNLVLEGSGEAPFSQFDLKGNTEQTGTPTPSAPVAVQTVTGENVVQICGKNLLKLPSAGTNAGVTYSINSDGTFNIHGTNNSGYEILFSLYLDSGEFQSVDYTLGAREALPYGLGCRCEIYRGGTWKRSFVSVNYTRQTQTGTPDFTDANRVRVAITIANGATVNIDNVGIQLELGSPASSFEPYQEQSYPISLGSIKLCGLGDDGAGGYLYKDGIYKNLTDNKWYVHKEVGKAVYSSSDFTLANNDNYTNVRYAQFTKQEDNIQYGNYDHGDIVNYFSSARNMGGMPSGGWDTFNAEGEVYNNATRTAWWCSFPKTTSLDTIKSKLNGMTAYYALATPTDTIITNEALIEQLDDIANHAHAYKERTHVSSLAATGNVPYIIAAAVTGDADGTVTNSGNIYSKPKLTIFGSGDIGVYLNGVQMFQIALGSSGHITIDTALMEAYQDNLETLMNRQVTGDYSNFKLPVGDNTISFSGIVSMCVVENYSRWL